MNDIGKTYFLAVSTGNVGKFIGDFTSTWRRLPADVQENILKYWSNSQFSITFELSNFWKHNENKNTCANAGARGCELKFRSDDFEIMPPEVAQYIIAHELAHVYQFSAKLVTGKGYDFEGIADKLAKEWGFDYKAQIAWRLEQLNKSR
ncbi:MAG: hypothetical protein WAX69_05470 [Victivallales bacterium]